MVASHAVGVSPDFLRDVSFVEVTEDLTKMLELARPRVAKADSAAPESPEGWTPPQRQQDEHRTPPPPQYRGAPPRLGPQPVRKAAA